jgi:hypothetical protein
VATVELPFSPTNLTNPSAPPRADPECIEGKSYPEGNFPRSWSPETDIEFAGDGGYGLCGGVDASCWGHGCCACMARHTPPGSAFVGAPLFAGVPEGAVLELAGTREGLRVGLD